MTKEDLKFYNSQDKEELVIMCIARENKIKYLQQENKQLKSILTELEEWIENDKEVFETTYYMGRAVNMYNLKNKIQELKEKYK